MSQPVSYWRLAVRDDRLHGRLSGPGFAMVAAASLLALMPFNVGWQAAFVCVPLALILLALAFGRVSGLSADEWISRSKAPDLRGYPTQPLLLRRLSNTMS